MFSEGGTMRVNKKSFLFDIPKIEGNTKYSCTGNWGLD